jgi:peptidoglycan/LPS O-acetylase OafA/YrhL
MGVLRLLLAIMVLASHLGVTLLGLNPGVSAVVVFYFLAGSVVARLWKKLSADSSTKPQQSWRFLTDRFWRIAPMYYFSLVVAFAAYLGGANSYFLSGEPGLLVVLQNLLVIPLNYYMFTGVDTFTLLPPAWSLGAELQFYLLVPLLFLRPSLLLTALGGSLLVFALAQGPGLNTDFYGYRLLPGVLVFFLAGALWQSPHTHERRLLGLIWLAGALYAWALFKWLPQWQAGFNREVVLGFVMGVPLVIAVNKLKLRGLSARANQYAGLFSYGVFLLHFPVMWLYQLWLPALADGFWPVLAGSLALAAAGHWLVEKPLWRLFRKRF